MEKNNFINGYYLLETDLKVIFDFIEPVEDNYKTYSHRLYSLFIRTCIEFEANCKGIFVENNRPLNQNKRITDYFQIFEIEKYTLLKSFIVKMPISNILFSPNPLSDWTESHGPKWYQDHQKVKHNRIKNFQYANLENVLNAVVSVYILLFARYEKDALGRYQELCFTHDDDDGFMFKEDSLFQIKNPGSE